ncbi:helix-turn-helix domain-containing protein [Pseudonocardia benzenivorans]
MGDRQAIAAELHVHPQTVRYRLAKLHELFGDDLDDPEVRARMVLALSFGEARTPASDPLAVSSS